MTDEALQTLVSRLRAKIEPDRSRPRYVVTVRSQGYKFVEPPAPAALDRAEVAERDDYERYPLTSPPALPSRYRLPYRDYIIAEYVGTRHQVYENLLRSRNVVAIWGAPGIGKTWVGARLALQWEAQDQDLRGEPRRRAFWLECQRGMGLYDLAYAIAAYLHQQGDPSLWQMLQKDPDWTQRATGLVDHLVDRLDRTPYLLCLDDFHHVGEHTEIRLLLETMEKRLHRQATKVLLLSRRNVSIPLVASRELAPIPPEQIPELVLKLRRYEKEWLDPAIAQRFARRLVEHVGVNLALMNIVAIDWFRSNTSRPDAEAYLDALDESQIAAIILEHQDPLQTSLLFALTLLEDGADCAILTKLVRPFVDSADGDPGVEPAEEAAISRADVVDALTVLREAKLVYEDGDLYRLHESVREICYRRLTGQGDRLIALHRRAGELFCARGRRARGRIEEGSHLYLKAAHHYLKAEAYGRMVQVLRDHALDLVAAGRAGPQPARPDGKGPGRRTGSPRPAAMALGIYLEERPGRLAGTVARGPGHGRDRAGGPTERRRVPLRGGPPAGQAGLDPG